ncbi:hypothetical protein Hamer_G010021 [Homarus americanus]|uniref:Uncharacterized protein n=1 Tax=Homarus americanus TaxID=6706 RepID=A0A8J5JKF0_HOMAM|nr:hypothetical protein Hamer_G010021 [Homarus americanus]
MHIRENLLRSNWSSSQLGCKLRQFHWTMVAMIIGDLRRVPLLRVERLVWCWAFQSRHRVERCVCGFVATNDLDVDPSHGPTPELTPGDGSPDGGSIEVTHVPGVPAASSILAGGLNTRGFCKRISQPELTSVGVSGTQNWVLKLAKRSHFLHNSQTFLPSIPWPEDCLTSRDSETP